MKDKILNKLIISPMRIFGAVAAVAAGALLLYALWSPGGNAPLAYANNAVWIGHGWLGDDSWFARTRRSPGDFRSEEAITNLLQTLSANKIRTVYPHLCPARPNGHIAAHSSAQTERFLELAAPFQIEVLPWVGGVAGETVRLSDPLWRKEFAASIGELLQSHPRLAGVQINIEPLPSGDPDFLALLDEVKAVLGDKTLSVAAYPPPTLWQRSGNVHWELPYLAEVARRADQLAVMMYDTSVPYPKFYVRLMTQWTNELATAVEGADCELLLGIPAYEDAQADYHRPEVENLSNALSGIAAAAGRTRANGIAIYCEWEMTEAKWQLWRRRVQPLSADDGGAAGSKKARK